VYDAQSDQSTFSGFDDGNRDKTINIITKKDRRKGYFGKGSAGGGTDDRYAFSANLHRFNGNQQISFIGQGNNINQQNFSIQDIMGVMNSGGGGGGGGRGSGGMFGGGGGGGASNFLTSTSAGIATTWAGGLNYNDVWGKKSSVSGSYFYNNMDVNNDNESHKQTFLTSDSSLFANSTTFNNSRNQNHRFNFELDQKIDSFNSLLIRPSFSYQQYDKINESATATSIEKLQQSEVNQRYTTSSDGYNFSTSILFRHRFKKRGRTVSLNITPGLSSSDIDGTNLSYNNLFNTGAGGVVRDTVNQISSADKDGKTFASTLSYTEPIGQKGQIEVNWSYNYNRNTSDQQTWDYNPVTGKFDQENFTLSNKFENTNLSNRFGLSYRRQISKMLNYTLGFAVQRAELNSDNESKGTHLNQSFTNFFPNFQLQYSKNRTKNLRFSYRGRTNAPSISQLQNVVDNTNQLNITNGNPALKQEFSHNFNLFFTNFDVLTFKNFVASINGSFTQNKIGNAVIQNTGTTPIVVDGITLINGARYTRPVNLNGAMNFTGFINYGFPLAKPKSNVNLTTTLSYIRDVNLYNGVKSYTNNYVISERVGYTINVKEQFDLNFFSTSSYNIARYTQNSEQNGDYFTQTFSVEPTYSTTSGWILGSDFDYTFYRGQSSGYNQSIPLWNASIAKSIFKNKAGEIKLSVYDLLDQNKSITRTVEQNYVLDTRTQVLTRYFMLTFTYNLRNFAGKGQQQMPPFIRGMFKSNGQPRMRMMGTP